MLKISLYKLIIFDSIDVVMLLVKATQNILTHCSEVMKFIIFYIIWNLTNSNYLKSNHLIKHLQVFTIISNI